MSYRLRLFVIILACTFPLHLRRGGEEAQRHNLDNDLAALAQEVGGDKIDVESIAKGYQDPHFVEAKPSFLLKLRHADLLVSVGLDLEIGWLPPLITQSGNPQIQPARPAISTPRSSPKILEKPEGQVSAPWATCIRWAIRTTGSIPKTAAVSPRESQTNWRARPGRCRLLSAALSGFRQTADRGRTELGRPDEAATRTQGRHLPQVVAQLCQALRPRRDRIHRAAARYSAHAAATPSS